MNNEWKEIEAKFKNKCLVCGHYIEVGESCMWMKGKGIKHKEECIDEQEPVDNSTFELIEDDMIWNDPKSYSMKELEGIKKCQRCGTSLKEPSETFINADRKTCEGCFKY